MSSLFNSWSWWPPLPDAHGTPRNPHAYQPRRDGYRECATCHDIKPPTPESITIHPADRANFNQQLPTATIYGEPIPDHCPIIEDPGLTPGTIRVHIHGSNMVATLGLPPEPKWLLCNPYTGIPYGDGTAPAETGARDHG